MLERSQRRGRLDAELVDEQGAVVAEHGERLRVAAGSIERDHQLCPERLPQRVLAGQGFDLWDHRRGPAAGQLGLDETLLRDQAQLLETLCLGTCPVLVGELRVGVTAPQGERLPKDR